MKGPFERFKYDLRRVWECPACHHRERAGGEVTFRLCACQRKVEPRERVWMRLVQEAARCPDPIKPNRPATASEESPENSTSEAT